MLSALESFASISSIGGTTLDYINWQSFKNLWTLNQQNLIMKNFIKLAVASILGLMAMTSVSYAKHHEGKKHHEKQHAEKAEKSEKTQHHSEIVPAAKPATK